MIYLETNTETNKSKGEAIWEASYTLDGAGVGQAIVLPNQIGKIDSWVVGLAFQTAGSAKIQYTFSKRSEILAGTATWRDWDAGTASSDTDDVFYEVAAVRLVVTSGTVKIEVRVQ